MLIAPVIAPFIAFGAPSQRSWIPSTGGLPRTVQVLDMRKIGDFGLQNLAVSVEGLVNSEPGHEKVYLIWSDQDVLWLSWLKINGYIKGFNYMASMKQLVAMSPTKKAVVMGGNLSQNLNIATTLAGCKRDLLVTNQSLLTEFGLKEDQDLVSRFSTNAEAYRWLIKTEKGKINPSASAIYVPLATANGHAVNLRDYLIANRIFTFWISGSKESDLGGANSGQEREVVGKFLNQYVKPNTPCFGYPWSGDGFGPGEGDGVTFLSQHAKWLVATDTFDNLSFWSTFLASHKKLPQVRPIKIGKSIKHLASVVVSDGDNLCTFQGWFPLLWQQLSRLEPEPIPIGWTMGPTLQELAPPMFDYATTHIPYLGTVGSGVSGIGYMSMEEWGKDYGKNRGQVVRQFLSQTSEACAQAGEKWLWIMRYGQPGGWEIKDYAKVAGIKAIMGGYGKVVNDPSQGFEKIGGVSVFHSFLDHVDVKGVESELKGLLNAGRLPDKFQIFLMNWGTTASDLVQLDRWCTDHGIQLVAPEQLASSALPSN